MAESKNLPAEKQLEAEAGAGVLEAITLESLQEKHKNKAVEVYDQIAQIGFGAVGGDFVEGRPSLDIHGLREAAKDAANPKAAESAKQRLSEIKKLLK